MSYLSCVMSQLEVVVHVFNFVILDVLLEGRRDGSSFGKDEIPKKGLKISLWIWDRNVTSDIPAVQTMSPLFCSTKNR